MTKCDADNSKRTAHRVVGRPFKSGQSGNPGGRPKAIAAVQELAREHTTEAVAALVGVMNSEKSPPSARVAAASALLDRGWGRAPQTIKHESLEDRLAKLSDRVIDLNIIKMSIANGLLTEEQAKALPPVEYDKSGRRLH